MIAPPVDVAWLAEFLVPSVQFDIRQPGSRATRAVPITVELEGVVPRNDALLRRAEPRLLFVRDGAGLQVPCVTDRDGTLVVWHPDGQLVVSPDRRHVTIRPHHPRAARQLLLLVVRELFMSSAWRVTGGVILHAAAVRYDGVTLVVCGPRESGKTTLACRVALGGGVLVANDRVAFGEGSQLLAVPTIVTVRTGTVELLSLRIPWAARSWQYLRRMDELDGAAPDGWPSEPAKEAFRWTLSPPQLAAVLDASLGTASRAVVLVFPEVDSSARGAHATRLASEDTRRRLAAQVLGSPGARTSEVLAWPDRTVDAASTEHIVDRTLHDRVQHLPGFHLRLGRGWDRLGVDQLVRRMCSDHEGAPG